VWQGKKIETNEQGLAAVVAMAEQMPGFLIVEGSLSSHHSAKPNVLSSVFFEAAEQNRLNKKYGSN